jgi:hypothetical protein
MPRRNRRRWTVAASVAAGWLALVVVTGSLLAATMLLIILAGLGLVVVLGLRSLGVTRDHPWVRRLAERPWRDGQDVLRLAVARLHEVFVITPSGSLLAPDLVEVRMNPRDLQALSEQMDLGVASESATEVYQEQVAARAARLAGHVAPEVRIIGDPSVAAGRYQIRQRQPAGVGRPAVHQPASAGSQIGLQSGPVGLHAVHRLAPGPGLPAANSRYPGFEAHDGNTRTNSGPDGPRTQAEQRTEPAAGSGMPTVAELASRQIPVLRLVTGSSVAQTRTSGARAGRGDVELRLPDEPTVSREHARFTFCESRWRIANLGRNGLTLNGEPLEDEQALDDGDVIRWGRRWNALLSRVEIG